MVFPLLVALGVVGCAEPEDTRKIIPPPKIKMLPGQSYRLASGGGGAPQKQSTKEQPKPSAAEPTKPEASDKTEGTKPPEKKP